ncbi:MAG: hypothetical protein FWD68_11915 [Alphaproteobacteria bacterium]|nr:hypothetical protein [Alphaproteobacteria bacterium]
MLFLSRGKRASAAADITNREERCVDGNDLVFFIDFEAVSGEMDHGQLRIGVLVGEMVPCCRDGGVGHVVADDEDRKSDAGAQLAATASASRSGLRHEWRHAAMRRMGLVTKMQQ